MQEHVEMIRVERPTRCSCGEGLRPGERAGQLGEGPGLLCLWCLADLQAGRPRTRRVETPWPAPVVRNDPLNGVLAVLLLPDALAAPRASRW